MRLGIQGDNGSSLVAIERLRKDYKGSLPLRKDYKGSFPRETDVWLARVLRKLQGKAGGGGVVAGRVGGSLSK